MKRALVLAFALALPLACTTTSPRSGALEPRYIAVHNTLSAMGLAQVGPIQRGALAEGREARFSVDLTAECATFVAIGGADVRDVDLSVLDADDKLLAKDATTDSEAAVKVCPPRAGRYSLLVKMARGGGDFVLASWSGAPNASGGAVAAVPVQSGAGDCDSPFALGAGVTSGNTHRGNAENAGKCGSPESKEIVYRLELDKRLRVTLDLQPMFDSILYVRKDECAEKDAEVACNDDAPVNSKTPSTATHASRIEEVFDPGTYFVFVDGYQQEVGAFKLNVELLEIPSVAEECKQLQPLVSHAQGTLTGSFDALEGSCESGKGPEVPYRIDIPAKARARVRLHSDDFSPVLHMRRSCADDATEVACTDSGMTATETALVATLDPGAYTVFADSAEKGQRGHYTIDVDLTPDGGKGGVRGEACADAIPIVPEDKLVLGDTFDAKDDFSSGCAAAGAPDLMYRFEMTARSRVTARFDSEEGSHVFVLSKSCTDRATELSCNHAIDEVLAPGVYYLGVDGSDKGAFGRFGFRLRAKDVSLQDAACKAPGTIALGQIVTGTTQGAPDRFVASCGGRLDSQSSGDRVFKLTVPTRQRIQLLLSTPNDDGVLVLRKACLDPATMKNPREVEVSCNNDAPDTRHSKIDTTVDAGTYFVVVDGHQGKNEGPFTLEAKAMKP